MDKGINSVKGMRFAFPRGEYGSITFWEDEWSDWEKPVKEYDDTPNKKGITHRRTEQTLDVR